MSPYPKPRKSEEMKDSMTKVHFSKSGAYKYISGVREPRGIRIDTGLYSVFKPLAKRVYGSVCRAVELYIIAIIEAVENGVHFSNTDKPINIEKIVIERNLRPRRKLEFLEDPEWPKCAYCGSLSIGFFLYNGKKYPLCGFHATELLNRPNTGWR